MALMVCPLEMCTLTQPGLQAPVTFLLQLELAVQPLENGHLSSRHSA